MNFLTGLFQFLAWMIGEGNCLEFLLVLALAIFIVFQAVTDGLGWLLLLPLVALWVKLKLH